jgi:hypothetical protein
MAKPVYFPAHGFVADELPINFYNELLLDTQNRANKVSYRNNLVGSLSEEYLLEVSDSFENYLASLCRLYDKSFNIPVNKSNPSGEYQYNLRSAWVNYQKKYEYNSVHDHHGDYSFVIWLKIPYDLQEEMNQPHVKGAAFNYASQFCFHYPSQVGNLSHYNIPVDKTFEGKIILFDAKLSHSVNPFFTSDEERISIAGNLSRS